MPRSIQDADYLTMSQAAKLIPGTVHKNTLIRWCDRGFAGIILESYRCGNRRMTTVQAIDAFISATSRCNDPNPRRTTTSAHQRAEAELDALGV